MSTNILSNVISGEFKTDILDRTFDDIYNNIKYLYGPGATDNFIVKNGKPYFTRDGKEVFDTFHYDNDVSMMLHTIMKNAIEIQGERAGDGTTTLIIFSICLYKVVKEFVEKENIAMFELRKSFNRVVDLLKKAIKNNAKEISVSDEDFKNMIYTTTQDEKLTEEILEVMKDANKDTFINIERNDFSDEIKIEHIETPVLKGEMVYDFIENGGKYNYPSIFYIKGQLEIVDPKVLEKFITGWNLTINRDTIIICNGTTSNTRAALKKVKEDYIKVCKTNGRMYPINNLHIFKADSNYFANEEISTDITMILYEKEFCSLFEKNSFEEYLKILCFTNEELDELKIPSIFDFPTGYDDEFVKMAQLTFNVDYNPSEGLKLDAELGPKTLERMEALKKEIKDEQSQVKKTALSSRYKQVFGSFINVSIGAKLLKDSQRDYELLKDAIISGQHALNSGVIRRNSLVELISLRNSFHFENEMDKKVLELIIRSTLKTLKELLITRFGADSFKDNTESDILFCIEEVFDEVFTGKHISCEDPLGYKPYVDIYIDKSSNLKDIFYDKKMSTVDHPVIEPVDIITNVLDLSKSIAIDFALSKFIVVGNNNNLNNYI